MQLDRYDRQILELLQQDGRISNQDLADRIGCRHRPACAGYARWKRPG